MPIFTLKDIRLFSSLVTQISHASLELYCFAGVFRDISSLAAVSTALQNGSQGMNLVSILLARKLRLNLGNLPATLAGN